MAHRLTFAALVEFGKKHGINIERRQRGGYDVWKHDDSICEEKKLEDAYSCMVSLRDQKENPEGDEVQVVYPNEGNNSPVIKDASMSNPAPAPVETPVQILVNWYLDWYNDYLTVDRWAEHKQITVKQANLILRLGKGLYEARVMGLDVEDVFANVAVNDR